MERRRHLKGLGGGESWGFYATLSKQEASIKWGKNSEEKNCRGQNRQIRVGWDDSYKATCERPDGEIGGSPGGGGGRIIQ